MSPEPMPRTLEKPVRRGRPAKRPAAVPVETRSHILDHAEALFALHGLHGVTVREVARAAAVDAALVHYYFETKQGLFEAVFERRATVLNEERLRSMDQYALAAGGGITVDGCVQAASACRTPRMPTSTGATTSCRARSR